MFHWIFRATRNWDSVSGLLPSMREHASHTISHQKSASESTSKVNLKSDEGEITEDYSTIFRELFCVAADELAGELNEPLENVGVLFDEIFNTGHAAASSSGANWNQFKSALQVEKGNSIAYTPGRGLLLFLVRVADRKVADVLAATGYRFTEVHNVANIITRRMQIHCNDLKSRLNNMYEYASESHTLRPGVHLACFAIRASMSGGFDVLVCKDARNKLPSIRLPFDSLDERKIGYLSQLENKTVAACSKMLSEKSQESSSSEEERSFAAQLLEGLTLMGEEINHSMFTDALLISKPVSVPLDRRGTGEASYKATLIAFRLLLPI